MRSSLHRWQWSLLALAVACQSPPEKGEAAASNELLLAADAWLEASAPKAAPRSLAGWARDDELQSLAVKLQTRATPVDNPCLQQLGNRCVRTALDPFFLSLDQLATRQAPIRVVVSAFGNSLIAGDKVIDRVRLALTAVFGDGGRGLLLADRMASYGPRSRTGDANSKQWSTLNIGKLKRSPYPFGLTGIWHQSTAANARSRYDLQGERHAAVWWVDVKGGGALSVEVDGREVVRTMPRGDGAWHSEAIELPTKARTLDVIAQKGALIHGVVLDGPLAGVVVDTLGVPSADATLFLDADEAMTQAQLKERDPKLMLFMFGGNEAKRIQWEKTTLAELETDTHRLIKRARTAVPQAGCLVVGPLDATDPKGRIAFEERPSLQPVIQMERQVAAAEGCAFFNLYDAMGGKGALKRFNALKLVHDDKVHPRGQGLDVLGELLASAMLESWVKTPLPMDEATAVNAWQTLAGAAKRAHGDFDVEANSRWLEEHGWLDPASQTFTEKGKAALAAIGTASVDTAAPRAEATP